MTIALLVKKNTMILYGTGTVRLSIFVYILLHLHLILASAVNPTGQPTGQPTSQPTGQPTAQPTTQPTGQSIRKPTIWKVKFNIKQEYYNLIIIILYFIVEFIERRLCNVV